jgi:hypothetical protein
MRARHPASDSAPTGASTRSHTSPFGITSILRAGVPFRSSADATALLTAITRVAAREASQFSTKKVRGI